MMEIIGLMVVFMMVFGGYMLADGDIMVVLEALPCPTK